MRLKRITLTVVAVTMTAGLAACTPPGPAVEPTAAPPTVAPTQTPTPTPTPTAEATPDASFADLSDWLITSTSVGPITIGDDFELLATAATAEGWTRGCGDGREDDPMLFSPELDIIVMAYDTGAVQEIVVKTPGMATDAGFKIRDEIADVRTLYPDATETQVKNAPEAYRVAQDGVVTYFADYAQAGNADTIILTTQQKPSEEYCG